MRPSPIPTHLLGGDSKLLDGFFWMGGWFTVAVRWLAIPVVLWMGGWLTLIPLTALLLLRVGLSRRRPRSCASPIGEEALFLMGCGVVATLAAGQSVLWLLSGFVLSAAVVGGVVAAVWGFWGRRFSPVQMRQPWFRVLADNPSTVTMVAKVRVGEGPVTLRLPRCADGPVSAVLYSTSLKTVARVPWEAIKAQYEAGAGEATLEAAFGRYVLSVRHYRPWADFRAPELLT